MNNPQYYVEITSLQSSAKASVSKSPAMSARKALDFYWEKRNSYEDEELFDSINIPSGVILNAKHMRAAMMFRVIKGE